MRCGVFFVKFRGATFRPRYEYTVETAPVAGRLLQRAEFLKSLGVISGGLVENAEVVRAPRASFGFCRLLFKEADMIVESALIEGQVEDTIRAAFEGGLSDLDYRLKVAEVQGAFASNKNLSLTVDPMNLRHFLWRHDVKRLNCFLERI